MTLREALKKAGFLFNDADILLYQPTEGKTPAIATEVGLTHQISFEHPILDTRFNGDLGYYGCPRFLAYDRDYVYFPVQYDGATWVSRVPLHPACAILHPKEPTPYLGRS